MDDLYLNEHWSDLVCYVGKTKSTAVRFPTHRCVLTLISPAFSAMLGDDNTFEESKTGEVLFTDITANAFQALLFYAYTKRLRESSILTLIDILHASKKYLIDDLTAACLRQISCKDVTFDNFWSFFSVVHYYYSTQMPAKIVLRTKRFLICNVSKLLQHVDAENLPYDIVITVVDHEFLCADKELDVFNFIVNWATAECCRRKLDVNPINQRLVLGDILYKVRYLLMPKQDLRNGPIKSKILTSEECKLLLQNYSSKSLDFPLPWNNQRLKLNRKWLSLQCLKLQSEGVAFLQDPNRQYFVMASRFNFIFVSAEILVLPSEKKIEIECEIEDLRGVLITEWDFTMNFDADVVKPVTIVKFVSLNALTCYKLKIHFKKGEICAKRFSSSLWADSNGKDVLYVGGNSIEPANDFTSTEFWQKTFDQQKPNWIKQAEPTVVSKICCECF